MNFEEIMAYTPYNKQNFNSLIDKIRSSSIVPYIGAGMSSLFENIYPSWKDFLNKTFVEFMDDSIINEFNSLSYEDRADFLYTEIGHITFADNLKDTFGQKHLDRSSFDFWDKAIYLLPFIFDKGLLITTNYDKVIEKIYGLHEIILSVMHPGHFEALHNSLRDEVLLLYKIHGDITEPINSIILTKKQYELAYNNSVLTQTLKQVYFSKAVLFLGCSLDNDRPIKLLCESSESGMHNYAIIGCKHEEIRNRRLQLENEYYTKAIIYPEEKYECVNILLDNIAQIINPIKLEKFKIKFAYMISIIDSKLESIDHNFVDEKEIFANKTNDIFNKFLKDLTFSDVFGERELAEELNKNNNLVENIINLYYSGKISFLDFCGRRTELKELIEKMGERVEVYGVGGIGKTTLIHIALLICQLKGYLITTIGPSQSYVTGSGYCHFYKNKEIHNKEVTGDKITLYDVLDAIEVSEVERKKDKDTIMKVIREKLRCENRLLFIDDFHIADEDVIELAKSIKSNLIISTKSKIDIGRKSVFVNGIAGEERDGLINNTVFRFNKQISTEARNKIESLSEGHPVSIEIMVRNSEVIDFDYIESFKLLKDLSNSIHMMEFLERVVCGVFKGREEALNLLYKLSVINTDIRGNIHRQAAKDVYDVNFDKNFGVLIDTGMIKRKNNEAAYEFTFRHIQEAINSDEIDISNNNVIEKTIERHKSAIDYYLSKKKLYNKFSYNDQVELFFHKVSVSHSKQFVKEYEILCDERMTEEFGYKKLIYIGKLLHDKCSKKHKANILSLIGEINNNLKIYPEAKKYYEASVEIYNELNTDPNTGNYKRDIANTKQKYANLCAELKKFEEAEMLYKESLKEYSGFKHTDVVIQNLASLYYNLGNMNYELGRYIDSRIAYNNALIFFKKIQNKNMQKYIYFEANIRNNKGLVFQKLRQYDSAEESFKAAINQYANQNYKYIAITTDNIGDLYTKKQMYSKAKGLYEDSLNKWLILSDKNPDVFLPDVAHTQSCIGYTYLKLNNIEEAQKWFNDAERIYNNFKTYENNIYSDEIALFNRYKAEMYRYCQEFEKASVELLLAKDAYLQLNKETGLYQTELAELLVCEGKLDIDSSNYETGLNKLSKVAVNLELLDDLGAECIEYIGIAYDKVANYELAVKSYIKAAEINYILYEMGVKCLDKAMKCLQRACDIGDSSIKTNYSNVISILSSNTIDLKSALTKSDFMQKVVLLKNELNF